MHSSSRVILAIAPGKREFGIAVFVGTDLTYASVKTLRKDPLKKSLFESITGMLQKIFENFSIEIVVVKAISQYQKLSPDLDKIIKRIKFEGQRKNLPVVEVSIEQIKAVLGNGEKITEKRAFEALIESYPELEKYRNRPNKWQNDYYAFLFSAVAVGVVYLKTFHENS